MADWQTIVSRHSPAVWRTAYRLLGNRHEAADCFQETFLTALELSRRQKVRNWPALLVRLCTCRAMDQLRRRLRQADRHDELADFSTVATANPGPVEHAQAAELTGASGGVTELPDRQADVFCLRCLNELSYREIARQLGIKTSAVGVLLHRARARLRELLSPKSAVTTTEDAEV